MMTDQQTDYDQRAQEYEQKAKRVTDPWVRQRYLLLAKRYRDGGGPNLQRAVVKALDIVSFLSQIPILLDKSGIFRVFHRRDFRPGFFD